MAALRHVMGMSVEDDDDVEEMIEEEEEEEDVSESKTLPLASIIKAATW